jgi:GH25 family lysozyme M1 (1,4-beta-N-acetylmuramidase)
MAIKTKRKSKQKSKKTPDKKQIKILLSAICIFAVCAVIIGVFSAKNGSKELVNINKDVAYGIDVSYHNGKIDWKTVKDEVDFAFIRVGFRGYDDGLIHLDSKAKYNLKNANKYEVPIGVYFYSQAINESEAEEEAKFLISKIKDYDISLPVVIDFEYPTKDGKNIGRLNEAGLSRKEKTNLINAFCKKVKASGYTPAVYASSYIYRSHINMRKLDSNIMIWVADYNEKVTYSGEYDFWQFSDKGSCKGVSSKYVDTNYWYIKQ